MSQSCCESKSTELKKLRGKQKTVLLWVLIINFVMFVLEFSFGLVAKSVALMGDSLDMLGDTSVYAFSLYVLNKSPIWRARAGLLKGIIMVLFGLFVLTQTIITLFSDVVPHAETMGSIGTIALIANLICLILLYRHRSDDINMRSTWLCSRNDIIANLSVLAASFLVMATNSGIPDLVVGFGISALFLKSALSVIQEARLELA